MLSRMNKKCWKALISVTKQGSGWFSHFDPPTRITKVSRWDWTRILERLILLISRNDDFFVKKKKNEKKIPSIYFQCFCLQDFFTEITKITANKLRSGSACWSIYRTKLFIFNSSSSNVKTYQTLRKFKYI